MKTTPEREKGLRKPRTQNKTLLKIILHMLTKGATQEELADYVGIRYRNVSYLVAVAIEKCGASNATAKRKYTGRVDDINAEEFKWERQITEDDLMQMPLPYEWRLPIFK